MRKIQLLFSLAMVLMVSLNANAWKFTVASPAEGEVETLYEIVLNEPAGTTWVDEFSAMPCNLTDAKGNVTVFNLADNFQAQVAGMPANYQEITTPGVYTLTVPAGTFHIDGVGNEECSFTWTVTGKSDDAPAGDGETEVAFNAYDLGSSYIASYTTPIEGEGVTITPGDNVSVHVYEMGDLFLAQGSLTFTSKKDKITSIVFEGMSEANVTKGSFEDGKWTVDLANGESATITSLFGSAITKITVNYNGGSAQGGTEDQHGTITVQWPVENQGIEKITDGGVLAQFTTTKDYAQITVELRNLNETYHNLYDLPVRYMDGIAAGEVTCTTATPGTASAGQNPAWYAYNGDAYELIIKGYVNYWDVDYDAIATVNVRGESSLEHEVMSDVELMKITPETATEINIDAPRGKVTSVRDNIITLEFSGAVSSIDAVRPGSLMSGESELHLANTVVAGTDGKVWQFTIPASELSIFDEGGEYGIFLSAKDAEGHPLVMNERSADHQLGVMFAVTHEDINSSDVITLGTPAFSIVDGAEDVDPSTAFITVNFPEAQGIAGDVIVKVAGQLACRDMSTPVDFEVEGSINGVNIPVSLAEGKGYMFTVNTVSLMEQVTVEQETFLNPIGVYNVEKSITFFTGGEAAPAGELGAVSVTTTDNKTFTITFVEQSDVCPTWNQPITLDGVEVQGKCEMGAAWNVVMLCLDEAIDMSKKHTLVFTPGSLSINMSYNNQTDIVVEFGGTTTGINAINAEGNATIYNIAGQKVNGNVKGIVIINGKKYMLK